MPRADRSDARNARQGCATEICPRRQSTIGDLLWPRFGALGLYAGYGVLHGGRQGVRPPEGDFVGAPQVPLHSQGVGGPSSDLVFVHEGSCFTHSADVPVLPPFRRGSLPSHHGPDLEKLRTVSSTMCLKSSAGSRLHFGNDGGSLPSERNRCSEDGDNGGRTVGGHAGTTYYEPKGIVGPIRDNMSFLGIDTQANL